MNVSPSRRLLSGSELRRLLVLRERLRGAVVGAPRSVQIEVLQALEAGRQARVEGRTWSWAPPAMTRDELIREIKWRLEAAGISEVDAAAHAVDRASRRAGTAARRRAARAT
jgi:hypothetical protein